jgi:hypothetical protein
MSFGSETPVALGYSNNVTLVRPDSGAVVLTLTFHGLVGAIAATGPGQLAVAVGNRLLHVEFADEVLD